MIEFIAYLSGSPMGLHFACSRLEGDEVVDEWAYLNAKARELTETVLASPLEVMSGEREPDPMVVLALIVSGVLGAHVDYDVVEPEGRKTHVTVRAGLTTGGDVGN